MPTKITMPRLGESVSEGTVGRWLKQVGETVKKDEALVEIMTDKVTAEYPSPVTGKVVRILVAEDATVPVGTEIAEIEEVGGSGASAGAASTGAGAPPTASGRCLEWRRSGSRDVHPSNRNSSVLERRNALSQL